MENRPFNLPDHTVEARLARLSAPQAEALEKALGNLFSADEGPNQVGKRDGLPLFLLPLAELGLTWDQMVGLVEKVPAGYVLDHREIYFDFRLGRWMKHIEPPTVAQILEEYIDTAESKNQGLTYLKQQWQGFLRRQGAG
ncbi:MAG: hypothetical protein M3Y08_05070 [Fibrobacterota bacterium]|nr:hypothetical protein [Fibrobacterota bacterium]